MKKSFYLLLIIGFISVAFTSIPNKQFSQNSKSDELKWEANYEDAVKLAKKKKKPLLVFFTGSDWCGPCKMLHADLFENEEFIKLASKNLILYKADFPRKIVLEKEVVAKNESLRMKYQVPGYPTVILFNSKDEVIGKQIGYSRVQTTEAHLNMVKEAIEKYN